MDSRNARPGREDELGGDRGSWEVSTLPKSFDIRMFNVVEGVTGGKLR
jgi:hypothetical protein